MCVIVFDSTFDSLQLILPWQEAPNHTPSFTLQSGFLVVFSCPTHLPIRPAAEVHSVVWLRHFRTFCSTSPAQKIAWQLQTYSIYSLLCFCPFWWHVEFFGMLVSLGALVQWEEVLYYASKYLAVLVQSWVRRAIATPGASAAPVVLFRCRSWCWVFGAR